jgi:hypothetical protein
MLFEALKDEFEVFKMLLGRYANVDAMYITSNVANMDERVFSQKISQDQIHDALKDIGRIFESHWKTNKFHNGHLEY